jgi:hypothetical protein
MRGGWGAARGAGCCARPERRGFRGQAFTDEDGTAKTRRRQRVATADEAGYRGLVPRLSYFYGIAIYMYYRDHAPPHFHAIYGSDEVEFAPSTLHEAEILEQWERARRGEQLRPIQPLD